MEYLLWAALAVLAYGLVAPVASHATKEIPPTTALFVSTAVFLVIAAVVLVATGPVRLDLLATRSAGYVVVAGAVLTVGILAYIVALRDGPVSVVVPVYGMFIVGSSLIAIAFLGEALTLARVGGIVSAVLAIALSAGDPR